MNTLRRPNRTCRTRGCKRLAMPSGYCEPCNTQAATRRWAESPSKQKNRALTYNHPLYRKNREAAIQRDHRACLVCGNTRNLQVHHINHENTDHRLSNLVTVCEGCHMRIERDHAQRINGPTTQALNNALRELDQ